MAVVVGLSFLWNAKIAFKKPLRNEWVHKYVEEVTYICSFIYVSTYTTIYIELLLGTL